MLSEDSHSGRTAVVFLVSVSGVSGDKGRGWTDGGMEPHHQIRKRMDSPRSLRGCLILLTLVSKTVKINFCCLEPCCLCHFVSAALGK